MSSRESRRIDEAREALNELSEHYTNPRKLEADLDILFSALLKLPKRLVKAASDDDSQMFGLCDLLDQYAENDLIPDSAVKSCQELDELTQVADYDVPDEEEFAEKAEAHVSVIRDELDKLFVKLEEEITN